MDVAPAHGIRSGGLLGRLILLLAIMAAPARSRSKEPQETIREAFRASSEGLISGIGKGVYRHYRATSGDDWKLKLDADIEIYFMDKNNNSAP